MKRLRKSDQSTDLFDEKKSMGVMDRILIFVGILLIIFIVVMIVLFCSFGSIPDTLCTCVFAACTGELGITGMIQSTKNKYREREWQKEDEKELKENELNYQDESFSEKRVG